MLKVKRLDEGEMDFLREHYAWGDVWFDEAVRTLAHLEYMRRKCNFLTASPNESGPDYRDRIDARLRLSILEVEAMRVLESAGRKRVRKRGAAIRHRANAIYNRFRDKALNRAVRAIEALQAGAGVAMPKEWTICVGVDYDNLGGVVRVVISYPRTIINPFIP